jgi:tripartite-type tricarboxylate transporter receptor subunit TctC
MAAGLQQELHSNVQVINRPGAASQVGMTELVRSKPDGMTLGYAVLPAVVTNYLDPRRKAIYTRKSFQPIATHYIATTTLTMRSDSPFKTIKDLIEAARAAPGTITVSDSGLLGTPHLTALLAAQAGHVTFSSVHFPGGPQSVTAVLGGQVQVLAGGISDSLPYVTHRRRRAAADALALQRAGGADLLLDRRPSRRADLRTAEDPDARWRVGQRQSGRQVRLHVPQPLTGVRFGAGCTDDCQDRGM